MAKDKLGHGSEAHREGHKPQVEHGKYEKGSEYHIGGHGHPSESGVKGKIAWSGKGRSKRPFMVYD